MTDYLNLDISYAGSTDIGGSAYVDHLGHAASAIRDGKCNVALVTLAGRPRSAANETGTEAGAFLESMQDSFEMVYGQTISSLYAMGARRHMHEYETTSEQLAEIRVAASHHAQYNENAMYQDPVTVEDVVNSRMISDPLHLLDCCVISDGGGAFVVVSKEIRDRIDRECVELLGHGEAIKHFNAGHPDVTYTAARESSKRAYAEAGLGPDDIDTIHLYDSFTITVLETIEDLGFCEKGEGGEFVEGGTLKAPDGELPFNTDGGSLCSNHPDRGGMTKIIEAVRQLRREANEGTQVDADISLVHGTGGDISRRHSGVTAILGRVDR
jgi:acetyl-CoA C-acetyltransferase